MLYQSPSQSSQIPARAESPTPCPLLPCQGGEGRGEGGFEADGFINFGSAIGISPLSRGERVLIRVHRLSSLCAGRARFFALTPSPSPTLWERGAARGHVWSAEALASAWAEASLPHSIIPLSRKAGEGDKGVRAKRRACPFTPARRKSPPPQRFCTEPMYPYQPRGRGRNRDSLPARGEGWGGGYVHISLQRRL